MKLEINQPKSFIIQSEKYWNEIDVEIQEGEVYTFTAEGNWKDLLMETDADGYTNWYMSLYNCFKRSRKNKWFALLGSLNKREDFLIGKNNKILFQHSGRLFCYANDVKGFYWNNFGKISLSIMRIH
ncbi:hypothetical protein H9Q08_19775 [Chryseobacterium sp. PS-8]|uniref:Uncharacterized protein n=1 Tax=Chryseobacterium indicum TaxID=2766954 RepID=A0ABS9CAB4_9FLAO|nr:hypothetical protein [Chryseobacterium sp. PS-8]MCF2221509.1 hypothetical protein [Chryseobacterium sp. PS-8]